MRISYLTIAALAVTYLTASPAAFAQSFGGSRGGSSGFGSSGLGSSGFGSSGFGSSGLGGGSFGSSGFGGSSFGSSGFGGSGSGGGGFGGGFGSSGFGGGMGGASPFLLQNANSGFVGRTQADMNALFQSTTPTQSNFSGGNFQQFQQRTQQPQRSTETVESNTPPPVRVRLNVAFDVPAPATAAIVAPTVTRLSEELGVGGAELEMEGETAILRGTVASEAERSLAARIIMMEPGVWDVRNELVVAGAVSEGSTE